MKDINNKIKYIEKSFDEVISLKEFISFIIITTTEIETKHIHEAMQPFLDYDGLLKVAYQNQTYYIGIFGEYTVVHVQCSDMGAKTRQGSILTIIEAIKTWRNINAIVMIGIAFGIDNNKQKIGDVLVSEKIITYEIQKIGKENKIDRGSRPQAGIILLNRFKNCNDWEYCIENNENNKSKCTIGDILSGESLINNIDYKNELCKRFPTAIGGEMEGAGLYAAAASQKIEWILVKGICDFADGNKDTNKKNNQKIAVSAATSLCLKVFSSKLSFDDLNFVNIDKIKKKLETDKNILKTSLLKEYLNLNIDFEEKKYLRNNNTPFENIRLFKPDDEFFIKREQYNDIKENFLKNNNKKKIIFVTGKPGSGKSFLLRYLAYMLKEEKTLAYYFNNELPSEFINKVKPIIEKEKTTLSSLVFIVDNFNIPHERNKGLGQNEDYLLNLHKNDKIKIIIAPKVDYFSYSKIQDNIKKIISEINNRRDLVDHVNCNDIKSSENLSDKYQNNKNIQNIIKLIKDGEVISYITPLLKGNKSLAVILSEEFNSVKENNPNILNNISYVYFLNAFGAELGFDEIELNLLIEYKSENNENKKDRYLKYIRIDDDKKRIRAISEFYAMEGIKIMVNKRIIQIGDLLKTLLEKLIKIKQICYILQEIKNYADNDPTLSSIITAFTVFIIFFDNFQKLCSKANIYDLIDLKIFIDYYNSNNRIDNFFDYYNKIYDCILKIDIDSNKAYEKYLIFIKNDRYSFEKTLGNHIKLFEILNFNENYITPKYNSKLKKVEYKLKNSDISNNFANIINYYHSMDNYKKQFFKYCISRFNPFKIKNNINKILTNIIEIINNMLQNIDSLNYLDIGALSNLIIISININGNQLASDRINLNNIISFLEVVINNKSFNETALVNLLNRFIAIQNPNFINIARSIFNSENNIKKIFNEKGIEFIKKNNKEFIKVKGLKLIKLLLKNKWIMEETIFHYIMDIIVRFCRDDILFLFYNDLILNNLYLNIQSLSDSLSFSLKNILSYIIENKISDNIKNNNEYLELIQSIKPNLKKYILTISKNVPLRKYLIEIIVFLNNNGLKYNNDLFNDLMNDNPDKIISSLYKRFKDCITYSYPKICKNERKKREFKHTNDNEYACFKNNNECCKINRTKGLLIFKLLSDYYNDQKSNNNLQSFSGIMNIMGNIIKYSNKEEAIKIFCENYRYKNEKYRYKSLVDLGNLYLENNEHKKSKSCYNFFIKLYNKFNDENKNKYKYLYDCCYDMFEKINEILKHK